MSAPGWSPNTTTGDRQIDAAIYRFIHNPATLPCDVHNGIADWWQQGGYDGLKRSHQPRTVTEWAEDYKGTPPDEGFTRAEIMKART